jgi:hypothetical protein
MASGPQSLCVLKDLSRGLRCKHLFSKSHTRVFCSGSTSDLGNPFGFLFMKWALSTQPHALSTVELSIEIWSIVAGDFRIGTMHLFFKMMKKGTHNHWFKHFRTIAMYMVKSWELWQSKLSGWKLLMEAKVHSTGDGTLHICKVLVPSPYQEEEKRSCSLHSASCHVNTNIHVHI